MDLNDANKRSRRRPTRFTEDEEPKNLKPRKKSFKRSSFHVLKKEIKPVTKVVASVKVVRGPVKVKIVERSEETIKIGRVRYEFRDLISFLELINTHINAQHSQMMTPQLQSQSAGRSQERKILKPGHIDWVWISAELEKSCSIEWSPRECQRLWLNLSYGKLCSEHCMDVDATTAESLTKIAEVDFKAVAPTSRSSSMSSASYAVYSPDDRTLTDPPPLYPVVLGDALEDYEQWENEVINSAREEPGDVVVLTVQAGLAWEMTSKMLKKPTKEPSSPPLAPQAQPPALVTPPLHQPTTLTSVACKEPQETLQKSTPAPPLSTSTSIPAAVTITSQGRMPAKASAPSLGERVFPTSGAQMRVPGIRAPPLIPPTASHTNFLPPPSSSHSPVSARPSSSSSSSGKATVLVDAEKLIQQQQQAAKTSPSLSSSPRPSVSLNLKPNEVLLQSTRGVVPPSLSLTPSTTHQPGESSLQETNWRMLRNSPSTWQGQAPPVEAVEANSNALPVSPSVAALQFSPKTNTLQVPNLSLPSSGFAASQELVSRSSNQHHHQQHLALKKRKLTSKPSSSPEVQYSPHFPCLPNKNSVQSADQPAAGVPPCHSDANEKVCHGISPPTKHSANSASICGPLVSQMPAARHSFSVTEPLSLLTNSDPILTPNHKEPLVLQNSSTSIPHSFRYPSVPHVATDGSLHKAISKESFDVECYLVQDVEGNGGAIKSEKRPGNILKLSSSPTVLLPNPSSGY